MVIPNNNVFLIQDAVPGNDMYWQEIKPYEDGVNGTMTFPEGYVVSFSYGTSTPQMVGIFRSMVDRNEANPTDKTRWRVVYANVRDPNSVSEWTPDRGYDVNEIIYDTQFTSAERKLYRCCRRTYTIDNLSETSDKINNDLEISGHYALAFKDPWGEYENKNVKINAITNQESSGLFTKDSIFSEFYAAYDLGLGDFISHMAAVPDMYVVELIDSFDPIKYGDVVVIPKAIVDIDNCERLLVCDKFSITVSPIISHSEYAFERGEIIQSLSKNVRQKLREVREIGSAPIDVTVDQSDILLLDRMYQDIEVSRLSNIRLLERSAAASSARRLEELKALNREVNRLERELADSKEQTRILAFLIRRYNILTLGLSNSFSNLKNAWDIVSGKITDGSEVTAADMDPINNFISDINKNTAYGASTIDELEIMVSNLMRECLGNNSLVNLAKDLRSQYNNLIKYSGETMTPAFVQSVLSETVEKFVNLLLTANNSLIHTENLEYSKSGNNNKQENVGLDEGDG